MTSGAATAPIPEEPPARQRWSGLSSEDRRAARRHLLISTAFELLGSEGDAATTVRAVCQASRLNPRYFYESFADRDALLVAVYDQQVELLGSLLRERLSTAGHNEATFTRTGIETVVRFVADDPRRAKVLYTEALGNESLARRRIQALHDVSTTLTEVGRARHGGAPDGESIGVVAASLLVGGMTETLVAWLDGHLDVALEDLVEDLTALFLATAKSVQDIASRRSQTP